ncbi:MAG: ABC transporter substrate-binding protein [Pseudomonadota bacterium]
MAISRRTFSIATTSMIAAPFIARAATPVRFATNWYPQAEHGGHYQALALGLYRDAGLEVSIIPGGPRTYHAQALLAGKLDVRMGGSGTALNALGQDAPLVTVAAFFQKDPQIIMAHPDAGIKTLQDLRGKPILISQIGRVTFWPWLQKNYNLQDEDIRPYTFSMAPLLAREADAQQGYLTSEPYTFEQQTGRQATVFLLADHGLPGYATTIETTRAKIAQDPDLIERFVQASIDGWHAYLHDDPSPAHDLILQENPKMTADHLTHSHRSMIEHGIIQSGDAKRLGIGAMTQEKWQDHLALIVKTGALPDGLDVSKAFTTRFVNQGRGL